MLSSSRADQSATARPSEAGLLEQERLLVRRDQHQAAKRVE